MSQGETLPPYVVVKRHFDCLNELYRKLKGGKWTKLDMYWPYRNNNVSTGGNKVLRQMGIVERHKDDRCYYRWKGRKPTPEMAQKFAIMIIKKELRRVQRRLKQVQEYNPLNIKI